LIIKFISVFLTARITSAAASDHNDDDDDDGDVEVDTLPFTDVM